MTDKRMNPTVDRICREMADRGRLVEAGWIAALAVMVPKGMEDLAILRTMYFCGAQHLFSSILSILEPGSEATANDLRRMTLIQEELEEWVNREKEVMQ